MKNKFLFILSVMMVVSMVLAACAPAATPTPAEEPAVEEPAAEEPTEEPAAEEPAEEPPEEEPAPEVEQVLTGAFVVGPGGGGAESGRPYTGGAGHSNHIKLYVTPTIYNEDLSEIIPYAAESWEVSEDFTVWTYKLREDIVWSDGEPLTANDWKFTAEHVTAPDFEADRLAWRDQAFGEVKGFEAKITGEAEELEGVQVIDDYTVEYTLENSNPRHFTTQYRTYILPAHAIDFAPSEHYTTDWFFNADKQVSSGPFMASDYEKDAYFIMEKNPLYFEGEPKVDKLIIRYFGGDITAAVLALAAGEIDFSYVNATDLETLGDGYDVFFNNSTVIVYTDLHYTTLPEFWQDIKVRQAIMYAIDREAITKQILQETHYTIPCPIAYPQFWAEDLNWFEYDPEKAKALLAEAGVDPEDISMEWVGHAGYDNIHNNAALQAVQAFLAEIGINDVTYKFMDVPSFREAYSADGDWQFMYRGYAVPIYGIDLAGKWSNAGGQGGDFKGYDMVESGFEDAILAVQTAPTDEEYAQALTDFCSLHNELLPDLQLWIGNRYGVAGQNVNNFWWQPAGGGGPYKDNAHLWEMSE